MADPKTPLPPQPGPLSDLDQHGPNAGNGYGPGYGYGYGDAYGFGAAQPPSDVHLLDYVRVLYKRRRTATTAFIIVVLAVCVYTFTATPVYEGRTQLLIEPENPNVVSFKEVIEQDKSTTDYYQTQYRILGSRLLARKTIDARKLWNSPEFGGAGAGPGLDAGAQAAVAWIAGLFGASSSKELPGRGETAGQSRTINAFLDHLTVAPIRNSRLVDLRFAARDPRLAATIATTLARVYIEQTLEFKIQPSKEASDWLGEQLEEQRKRVEASEQALQKYKEQGDAVALDDRQNIIVQGLNDLNAALTRARTERFEKQSSYRQLLALQVDPATLDTFPDILSNTFIQQQKAQLADLERRQAQLGEKYGPNHPEMDSLRKAVETTKANMQAEVAKVVQSVRNEYLQAQAQERQLAGAMEQKKGEALALSGKGIDYAVLKREAESNSAIYNTLLQRAKETGVAAEVRTSNIRVVDQAEVPESPVRPNRKLNLLLAILGGGLFAVGLAFFFEYLDNRVKSPDEIKAQLALPFLGMVPSIKYEVPGRSPLVNNGVPGTFAEAFQAIRANVIFSSADGGARSIVITSTAPGEGKSLVAANLAIALAQAGKQVVLVDGDMRKPRVHQVFDVQQQPGLSNLIVGKAKASESIRRSDVSGLWLLPAGANPPNPAELLGSRRFAELLLALEQHFDWVVVDTPPVMAVTDAALAAHRTSGTVFVVGCEMTSRSAVLAAVDQLRAARAKVIGAVLNRVNVERDSYYYSAHYKTEYKKYYASAH